MGRSKKGSGGKRKGKKAVVVEIEEEPEEEFRDTEEELPEHDQENEGEILWEAVDWDEARPDAVHSVVFDEETVREVLKEVVDQAWVDGMITDDEMAMLHVLKKKLDIDDETFNRILDGSRPEDMEVPEALEEEAAEESEPDTVEPEEPDSQVEDEDPPSSPRTEASMEIRAIPPPPMAPRASMPAPTPEMAPPPPRQNIITFTHSIRGSKAPLGESFDLSKRDDEKEPYKRRCPHCRAMIRVRPGEGKDSCPICGGMVAVEKKETPGLRKVLDQAKSAFKEGDRKLALELYTIALVQSHDNKEAQFYLQKLQHGKTGGKRAVPKGDARNMAFIQTTVSRFDQLLQGGIPSGDQVLFKGPAFCGKELLYDKIMGSTLHHGIPVIYVSSNRAMKEVMLGIIRQVPDFRNYNQEGLVRMYDLFSKHRDGRVLKEGHRIFNIEDREDFGRFQKDLVFLMEELVREYNGGVMILNSLSPLITRADQRDLMKFLQVMIARSKSYRFTNILDMAAGVHPESVENSVEYLMDGIIEFRELDQKRTLKLKGFKHPVMSRDWVEYRFDDNDLRIVGSFQEERIL